MVRNDCIRTVASFLFAILLLCLFYRFLLCTSLYNDQTVPPCYSKQVPVLYFWKYFRNDLMVSVCGLVLVAAVCGLCGYGTKKTPRSFSVAWTRVHFLFANALLLLSALLMLVHYHLLFELNSGLTAFLLLQSSCQFGAGNFWALMRPLDLAFLLSPVAVFSLYHYAVRRPAKTAALCCMAIVVVVCGLQFQSKRPDVGWEIMQNPLQFLALDVCKSISDGTLFRKPSSFVDGKNLPSPKQMDSVRLIDPAFVAPGPQKLPPVCAKPPHGKWNVVFLVLESTGAEYVFDTSSGNEVPMPFLQRMSREGLNLTNHHANGNNSPMGGFSLFTGLYCRPDPIDFSTHARACVPTFNRLAGEDYKSFLITPGPTNFYFPQALLINNGMREIYDQSSIPNHKHPDLCPLARNEIDAVDFLLEKIDQTPEPFFGIYWSYLPHWPYTDYGEAYHIAHSDNAKRDSYYNNLRALDTQLERIFDHLQSTGKLENTLLVFVGDHGEAFGGRHVGYIGHGFGTYEETYKTPAIFYQPALFPPGQIGWATSHVDLLPTVLDALSIPYRSELLQGESVLRGEPNRKYIFTISYSADYLSAIDRAGRKVSLSSNSPNSYAYDLSKDPQEIDRLPSIDYPEQMDALVKFWNFQHQLIPRYNQCLWEKRSWEKDQASREALHSELGQ